MVSTYGESNAIQRADLKVENGKVTEATLNHRAATVTLKLVTTPGSEAFAGTAPHLRELNALGAGPRRERAPYATTARQEAAPRQPPCLRA